MPHAASAREAGPVAGVCECLALVARCEAGAAVAVGEGFLRGLRTFGFIGRGKRICKMHMRPVNGLLTMAANDVLGEMVLDSTLLESTCHHHKKAIVPLGIPGMF